MSQITITTDSDELRARIFSYAHAVNSIIDLDLDIETEVGRCDELAGDLIDKLLEETEENTPQPVPEPPKVPIGWVAQHKETKGVIWSKLFSTAEYGNTRLKGDLAENVREHYEIVPVYV